MDKEKYINEFIDIMDDLVGLNVSRETLKAVNTFYRGREIWVVGAMSIRKTTVNHTEVYKNEIIIYEDGERLVDCIGKSGKCSIFTTREDAIRYYNSKNGTSISS